MYTGAFNFSIGRELYYTSLSCLLRVILISLRHNKKSSLLSLDCPSYDLEALKILPIILIVSGPCERMMSTSLVITRILYYWLEFTSLYVVVHCSKL